MRDTDAATDAAVARSTWTPVRARTLAWTLFVGVVAGSCCGIALAPPPGARFEARLPWPADARAVAEWARALRPEENAGLVTGPSTSELVVSAGSAQRARSLAREFAGTRAPGPRELAASLERIRERWRGALGSLGAGAQSPSTPAVECAARLLGRARWSRDLAAALPLPRPLGPTPDADVPEALLDRWDAIDAAARSRDVGTLTRLLADSAEQEDGWFAVEGAWRGWTLASRAEAWRRWQVACADAAETLARASLAGASHAQRELATGLGARYELALAASLAEPWRMFAASDPRTLRPLVRPIAAAWLPPLSVGAGAGVLAALLALLLGALLHPALPRVRVLPGSLGVPDPAVAGPHLHVVAGGTPSAVMRAALELAARRVALGERVLLVDGSSRLRLHERLGRDARWGLLECLAADMPVLGLVQYAGHPGLYLLPHGNAERSVGWSSLGRKLDEVVPHFARIVLALDPGSPAGIGDALRGRAMEGWWAGTDRRAETAADIATARFGIVFHGLDLASLSDPTLELLAERVRALSPPGPPPEPAPITAPAQLRLPPAPHAVLEPIVLDCDLQVRERLRLLAWMRRVEAEHRRIEVQAPS